MYHPVSPLCGANNAKYVPASKVKLVATDSYEATFWSLYLDNTNDAIIVFGSGTPSLDGRIWTVSARLLGFELAKNPPISVINVLLVRTNLGPRYWVSESVEPLVPITLNRVSGVADPNVFITVVVQPLV